ncbi:MAG: hypothetical protein N2C14_18560, partial [Planctomycetales bacterium]
MGSLLTTWDLIIFFGSLFAVMAVGLWSGRKEDTSEDYYLAGKTTRWWGVAGSIFGSNVSANHIVGMMGVGFSVGFAQSHFEISAIAGLLLCYGFLPVYRRLNVFTLSEYLSRRYGDASRALYAVNMIIIIVVIQMVPGFYIGSRSLNVLLGKGQTAVAKAEIDAAGSMANLELHNPGEGYDSVPKVSFTQPGLKKDQQPTQAAQATVEIKDGKIANLRLTSGGAEYQVGSPVRVVIQGGASFDSKLNPGDVDPKWYLVGILMMAVVTGTYTIVGGLKAVITTDVIQSVMMLAAGVIVAVLTFSHPKVGGWEGMRADDARTKQQAAALANPVADNANNNANANANAPAAADKQVEGKDMMHLYLPSNHPQLPWSGVLTGLMVLHFYYWGTNQFIVQRALTAKSDHEAKMGIIVAGFFKLLIPFLSIGTGIAAFYLFQKLNLYADQDIAFTMLMKHVVAPSGYVG